MNSNLKVLSDTEISREVADLLKTLESDPENRAAQKRLEKLYEERSIRAVPDYSL